jgi:multidrug efflux pump subunit AcrB
MYFRVAPLPDNPKNIDMVRMRDYIEDNVRPRMSSVAGVTVGRYDSLEQMQNTIIKRDDDRIVRLNDIAEIDLDHFETNSESWFKDEQVLSLQVKRESGSNVIDIKYAMLQEAERINEDLLKPAGMQIILNSDDVRYVEASISNVLFNLALGAVFATLVMYGLMRSGRATMIAVIGIPICTYERYPGMRAFATKGSIISSNDAGFSHLNGYGYQ